MYFILIFLIFFKRGCDLQNDGSLKSRSSGRYGNIAVIGNDSAKSVERVGEDLKWSLLSDKLIWKHPRYFHSILVLVFESDQNFIVRRLLLLLVLG
jgi:hypothetical protein